MRGGASTTFLLLLPLFLFVFFPAGAGTGGGGARAGFSTLAGAAAGLAGCGEGLEDDEAAWAGEGLAGAVAEAFLPFAALGGG